MKVAYFHGLESLPKTEKNDFLHKEFEEVYDPEMNYTDPQIFKRTLEEIKKKDIQLLIGSSMGGWFAYCLSTHTGIPTLLFNPAVHSRSFEPVVSIGNKKTKHTIVLGSADDIIDPAKTMDWMKTNCKGEYKVSIEDHGHRVPFSTFKKWINVNN